MRLPGRHVLYALSAVTMLAACSSNGARGGIASTNMNPTNPPATAETATVSPTPAPQSARTETWINLQVGDCLGRPAAGGSEPDNRHDCRLRDSAIGRGIPACSGGRRCRRRFHGQS